ncbi:uncharacterized protein LOC121378279 [Gigantopelta aegis]|uniref:uncharacterized protein LOC121378279 n=1 Tax=Gigantopelta aegis TaxID=1735272 RepID=UPI001B88BBED|nr:uncharacterized protein LOC121378279 [Gigantopelta aegis]
MERKNAWDALIVAIDDKVVLKVWKQFAFNKDIINNTETSPPAGPQCYNCPKLTTSFKYPFVHFFEKIASLKNLFLKNLRSCKADFFIDDDDNNDDDDDMIKMIKSEMCKRFKGIIESVAADLFVGDFEDSVMEDYFTDYCKYLASVRKTHMSHEQKHQVIMLILKPLISLTKVTFVDAVTEVHVIYWIHESYLMSSLNLVDACLQVMGIPFEAIMQACFSSDVEKECSKTVFGGNVTEDETSLNIDIYKRDDSAYSKDISIPKHRLVNYCCTLLVPSQKMSSSFCVQKWLRSVSLVLSLSGEISLEPQIIQHLRICSDFAALIIIPYGISSDTLLELGETIVMQGPDSEQMLCYIFSLLFDLRQRLVNAENDLQHFLACYLSSCLSADPNSQILTRTFQKLTNKIFVPKFSFFGPTLHQALSMEIGTGINMLNDDQIDDNEFIQSLNGLLDADLDSEEISVLAALVVDVLQHFFLNEMKLYLENNDHNSIVVKETLRCHHTAFAEDKLDFKRLAAIAFLKTIIISFSGILASRNVHLEYNYNYWQQICSIFRSYENYEKGSDKNITEAMQNMLLQALVKGGGLKAFDEIRQICGNMLEFLDDFNIDLEYRIQTLEQNPSAHNNQKEKAAFYSLKTNKRNMCSLLKCACEKDDGLMKMYSFVSQQIFLLQVIRPLTDTEKSLSEMFIKCTKESSLSQGKIHLFECLCATKDFNFPLLCISASTDNQNFSIASVLVHLFSIITGEGASETISLLSKCVFKPAQLDHKYLFSCPDEDVAETTKSVLLDTSHVVNHFDCSCTFVTAVCGSNEQDRKCSVCESAFSFSQRRNVKMSTQNNCDASLGYTCFKNDKVKNSLISLRRLTPVAFRLLQFLIHGSFIGSLALQNSTIDDLATVLKLDNGAQVIEHLTEQLQTHWKVLKTLTQFGDSQLCTFLHVVLSHQKRLLFENPSQFVNNEEREIFERMFDENVVHLMKERFHLIQKIIITNSETLGDNPAVDFEKTLNEIPDDHGDSKHLTRLFRITSPPTMENMEIEFLNARMGSLYPFLGLLFKKKVLLDMLSHLLPLVKWHVCSVRYLSQNIKRAKCCKVTLEDFVCDSEKSYKDDARRALLRTHTTFKESWNSLKKQIQILKTYNSDIVEMERIQQESSLAESLVMDDTSPLFQVMKALHNIQNEFLDDATIITLCMKCHSTSFLKKSNNTTVLPCINLEDITEKEIISNPLDEHLLKFSQCNTNPGCGLQRDYDFYQIEMQVADTCLINKTYLKIRSDFPQIHFSGEILRMSRILFDNIRSSVPQKSLNKELKQSVLQLKEENSGNLKGLLNYLEMAFNLLARNPMIQENDAQNVSQLLKQWQPFIPVHNPAVTTFCSKVQLCNIIGLYEFVEVLMADIVVDSLEDQYRKPIPDEHTDHLRRVAEHSNAEQLKTLIFVLKRFAFRYLSTSSVDAGEMLLPYLKDSTLWPTGIVDQVSAGDAHVDAGMLSPRLAVEHIVEVIDQLKKAVQEKKENEDKASAAFLSLSTKQPSQIQKKKIAKSFRKK